MQRIRLICVCVFCIQGLLAKKREQKEIAKELLEENEMQKQQREKALEQDRALDLKVMQFLKDKAVSTFTPALFYYGKEMGMSRVMRLLWWQIDQMRENFV